MQPPKLINQAGSNGSVIISEGDTLHLDCNAYGIPSPQIYWIYGEHAQSKFNYNQVYVLVHTSIPSPLTEPG